MAVNKAVQIRSDGLVMFKRSEIPNWKKLFGCCGDIICGIEGSKDIEDAKIILRKFKNALAKKTA